MKCRLNRCLLVAVVFILAAGCATTPSPLIEAASEGDTHKVQALLAKGAYVNFEDHITLHTALMYAAQNGDTDTVQALLAKGADVNAKTYGGFTALMAAKKKGHQEIVRMLKKAGAEE